MIQALRLTRLAQLTLVLVYGASAFGQQGDEVKASNLAARHNFVMLESECLQAIGDAEKCQQIAERLESHYSTDMMPEAISMLSSILKGGDMGMGEGWFKPAAKKHDWNWMMARFELEEAESVIPSDIKDQLLFRRLDRNGDRLIDANDLDWSSESQWVREAGILSIVHRMSDENRDSSVTPAEWIKLFDRTSQGQDQVGLDAFRRAFPIGQTPSGYRPGDEPSQEQLIRGFFSSEIGSHSEGPQLGERAPDFELSTFDRTSTVRLSSLLAHKPVVLIFGNYTCGPFRRLFPEFDAIATRFKDQVTFLGVYVREAHPEDGWLMESNSAQGVKLPQPKSLQERERVAQTCSQKLSYSFPLLVDTLDDSVGNAYSGMPARAYLIDMDGSVVYKGGRGPFGFIPGELEQAVVMKLLDSTE
jgi:thiol-disulfide isomerase/thioredoxin